jgi:hypothetical protein
VFSAHHAGSYTVAFSAWLGVIWCGNERLWRPAGAATSSRCTQSRGGWTFPACCDLGCHQAADHQLLVATTNHPPISDASAICHRQWRATTDPELAPSDSCATWSILPRHQVHQQRHLQPKDHGALICTQCAPEVEDLPCKVESSILMQGWHTWSRSMRRPSCTSGQQTKRHRHS